MGVRLGNRYVDPGGRNWMDPPLHYAPRALLDSLEVERGRTCSWSSRVGARRGRLPTSSATAGCPSKSPAAWPTSTTTRAISAFYKRVYDYIQGTPATGAVVIAVSTANGAPNPLPWSNVDAELYGADADLGVDLPGPLQLDGNISWVRGRRLDIDDNLYRIAPLRADSAVPVGQRLPGPGISFYGRVKLRWGTAME